MLLIVTYRADDLHRRHPLKSLLAELERGDASWIRLAGLARPDVAELVAKTAGAAAVQSVSLLFDRTAGNPFFIEELLAASTPVISLPEGLRELLLARLHDLPDSALAVLRPASVLGQGFTEDLLGAATGLPLPETEDALRQAVDHNILRATAGTLRFRHDLMREAIYDDLLPAQRHRLHVAAATAIEADETIIDPPGARWGVLALHWKSAGDRARALGASIQAARWASLVGAPSEAADHLETALTLWEQTPPESHPDGTDRAALLEQATEARLSAGQALRARALSVAAVTELAGSPDVERVALAHVRVGSCSRVAGEAAASAEAFQRAVGLLADRPPPAKATVMARYAGFLMVGQRVRQGLAAVEAALDLARRTGSRRRAAQLALATGHLDDARAHIAAALAISDRCDDMIYAPKACSVGISAEAACPAPDLGTVEALTTRLSGIEAMARSFGGQLLAEPAAFAAMARAEARELSGGPQPEAWQAAAAAWDHCGDQYWSALCRFRTADALLRAKGDRNVAARIAAEALAAARSLGAAPLAADLEVLSRRGRLPAGSSPDKPPRRLGLTEREAEVLDLLAEGRTNRQIGDVLFISEKTVSVHVTNLLRKLGVDSRREAAEISRRLR